MILRLNSK